MFRPRELSDDDRVGLAVLTTIILMIAIVATAMWAA